MFSSIRAGSAQIASGRTRDSLLWESEVVYDSAWPTSWLRAKGKPVPLGGLVDPREISRQERDPDAVCANEWQRQSNRQCLMGATSLCTRA